MNKKSKWENIGLTDKELEKNEFDGYYIYLHIDKRTNEIIYAGKGCRRRAVSFNRRPYYQDYIDGHIEVDILARFDDEDEALAREEMEVFYYKYINHCKYNCDEFHKGKCRGEVDETATTTDDVVDIEDKYDLTPRNIRLHPMELSMIRNIEYRNNLKNLTESLGDCTVEEIKDMIVLYEQLVETEEENDLLVCYRLFLRHMKKI